MKSIFLSLLGILYTMTAYCQEGTITGKVIDVVTQSPLAGATVELEEAAPILTDEHGVFSADCPGPGELTIHYIGYETIRQTVNNCDETFMISLKQSAHSIPEVEITASSNANKSPLYQPASIARIGAKELERGNGLFLDDAVNANIPGVYMERRSVSGGQQFNIRGYGNGVGSKGANNNFDGQGSKVYLNGIPVTDAEGITLMDDLDFGSIGNVEILKGPAGTLYGLAIAGVVNLSTLQPEPGKTVIGQDVMTGSYGLQRYTTRLQTAGKRASLLVNYGHQATDGYMDSHSASRKDFVNVTAGVTPNEKESFHTYFGYSKSYDERAGELTIDQYHEKDYSGNPRYIKNDAHSEIISFRAGLGHTYAFNKHIANTTSVFASGISNNSSSAAGWTDKAPINYGLRSTVDLNFDLNSGWALSSVTGIETQAQYATIQGYKMIPDSNDLEGYNIIGDMKSNQLAFTGTTSLFTQWTLAMPSAFSLTAGIGMSNMYIKLNDRLAGNDNPSSYAASYNGLFSPHLALNKVFNRQLSVYLAYSTGYKAPVSGNIFIPATGDLNTGLKPEAGSQWEVGTKGSLLGNKLDYHIAAFYARIRDKMTSIAVPLNSATTAYTYIANGGDQNNMGLEIAASYLLYAAHSGFFRSVHPFANFCYSDFKYSGYQFQTLDANKDAVIADYDDKAVAGVAPVTANAGIDLELQWGLYANASYNYRDAMPITSDGKWTTPAYSLLNAKLGIRQTFGTHFGLDVFAGADNLTGSQYYYMVFLNQLPDAYLPAPYKTNVYGGISLKYSF